MPELRLHHMTRTHFSPGSGMRSEKSDPAPCAGRLDFVSGQLAKEHAAHLVRRFCHRCPIRNECLQWALGDKWFVGIAGGAFFKETGGYKSRRMIWPHMEYKETNE